MATSGSGAPAEGGGTTAESILGEDVANLTAALKREKAAKRKMYSYLVKIADELKTLRNESEQLIHAAEYARKAWYEGGMWRGPNVLPGATLGTMGGGGAASLSPGMKSGEGGGNEGGGGLAAGGGGEGMGAAAAGGAVGGPMMVPRAPVSLSDLFLDIVTVTAFMRVGSAIQDKGMIDTPHLAYFAIFWQIWSKEASYSTRFDTTDISSHLETLLACFALLGGSLSAYADFYSAGCTRIMGVAMFVAILHVALHARVWYWFRDAGGAPNMGDNVNASVKQYAIFITVMNLLEASNWAVGISLENENAWRPWIFLIGILLNLRLPRGFMPNDFHAACSKRGVLFILLLGFNLQSIVGVASPYFNYWDPTWDQYAFLFLACFLLFMIKLLYVDDTYSIAPQDHALLYNRAAGFFFHLGNFALLLFTTVLGSGLNLLTQSFLAAAAALPNDAKTLVCGGFSAVVFSIAFIKSMHIRRVPTNPKHERMFFVAYVTQIAGVLAVVAITARMCLLRGDEENGFLAMLMQNEIQMLSVLVFFAVLLIAMSWLDEAVELNLYSDASEASEYRVQPFGFWACFKHEEPLQLEALALERNRAARLAQRSPLLGSSVMSFSNSMYSSMANMPEGGV
eukprot:CAMPEP_0183742494 /NCGR_PEP_ID=MMETSP0737-20130205/64726_1 /TAXON_ID=385413 /ORGANISM="Thalassiosira miniscula, Strain CCMP1093" /LENGTH=625 /DNA_ID=CAMNT_0025978081 /DNA_START=167 /DNA_END=2044 /DNA_ORIENTATION=+